MITNGKTTKRNFKDYEKHVYGTYEWADGNRYLQI